MTRHLGRLLNLALIVVVACCLWVAAGGASDGALTEGGQRARDTHQVGSSDRTWTGVAGLNESGLTSPDPNRASPSVSACGASSVSTFKRVEVTSCTSGRSASIAAIRKVFGRRAPAAIRVAACETGNTFDARAVGRAGERGLFQIHPVHFSWAQPRRLFDPVWNSRVAFRLSRGGTRWGPWSCRWAA